MRDIAVCQRLFPLIWLKNTNKMEKIVKKPKNFRKKFDLMLS